MIYIFSDLGDNKYVYPLNQSDLGNFYAYIFISIAVLIPPLSTLRKLVFIDWWVIVWTHFKFFTETLNRSKATREFESVFRKENKIRSFRLKREECNHYSAYLDVTFHVQSQRICPCFVIAEGNICWKSELHLLWFRRSLSNDYW